MSFFSGDIYAGVSYYLKKHWVIAFVLVMFWSLSVRLFIGLRSDQEALIRENSDAATYIVPAENLLQGDGFLNLFDQPEVTRTPGYPGFLAALMMIIGDAPRRLLLAQAIVLSFEVVVVYAFARRLLSPVTALVA